MLLPYGLLYSNYLKDTRCETTPPAVLTLSHQLELTCFFVTTRNSVTVIEEVADCRCHTVVVIVRKKLFNDIVRRCDSIRDESCIDSTLHFVSVMWDDFDVHENLLLNNQCIVSCKCYSKRDENKVSFNEFFQINWLP